MMPLMGRSLMEHRSTLSLARQPIELSLPEGSRQITDKRSPNDLA